MGPSSLWKSGHRRHGRADRQRQYRAHLVRGHGFLTAGRHATPATVPGRGGERSAAEIFKVTPEIAGYQQRFPG